ncbi:DNA photolyase family protein [Arcobacter lacus]|uniref:cryptochrome/photolyase family protein n=1 Tax=Arcobacter lacus TaxID=1912876 RepID=UPI0021BBB299|nr:deoxyribodipyrimidine photo-lyase [Arcobacter lacus]MCT7910416.1 DNA photolyase family protein [Arcobacter lacus]
MKQILWFRRDLRVSDSAILANAKDEVLPIFIFDKNILEKLSKDDKRVTFIYKSILKLKEDLKNIGLDLSIFYGTPKEVFENLKNKGFDSVLCSVDFDDYSKKRDEEISKIIPMKTFTDSFIIHPKDVLKKDETPYKVFTPFYKSLNFIWESESLVLFERNKNLKKIEFDYEIVPTLKELGFIEQKLPEFLEKSADELTNEFSLKISNYQEDRDFFYKNATSSLAVHLRFGLISPRELFNKIKKVRAIQSQKDFYIRELFWREFYNYILYHFPKSEFENLNEIKVNWSLNEENFQKWCEGNTGVPLIDAAMRYFNQTGTIHNRLRMIVSSYLTKNLLIDWKRGEEYFASKLLDYEASSNIGSWQWAASTGADSVPYFRIFNPYLQSAKFDKDAIFIKSVIPELKDINSKLIHTENGVQSNLFLNYPAQIVSIEFSRNRAIEEFKRANNEKS